MCLIKRLLPSKTKITKFEYAILYEDILWLDVSVCNLIFTKKVQCCDQLEKNKYCFILRKLAGFLYFIEQCALVTELQHNVDIIWCLKTFKYFVNKWTYIASHGCY